jgi:hypothetical protein
MVEACKKKDSSRVSWLESLFLIYLTVTDNLPRG